MKQETDKRVAGGLNKAPVLNKASVKRAVPSREKADAMTTAVKQYIVSELQNRAAAQKEIAEHLNAINAPMRELFRQGDKDLIAKTKALKSPVKQAMVPFEPASAGAGSRPIPLLGVLSPGGGILSPPWDVVFASPTAAEDPVPFVVAQVTDEGSFWCSTDGSYDGQIYGSGGNGFASAGVGVYLEAPVDVKVWLNPYGYCNYNWVDASTWGYTAHNDGGVAVTVTPSDNPTAPILDLRFPLWSDGSAWTVNRGFGTAIPGALTEGKLDFYMNAGAFYLVTVWCWISADCAGLAWSAFGDDAGSVAASDIICSLASLSWNSAERPRPPVV